MFASRSCNAAAGISPSINRTRRGFGAFHLRNPLPVATA
jgi:hypothetical protein